MLKQRVITAVILLAILLPALFASAVWPFALLTLLAVAAAGWEWGRLNGMESAGAVGLGVLVALVCAATWMEGLGDTEAHSVAWWGACLLWVLGGAWAIGRGPAGWLRSPKALRWALGALVLWLTWLALTKAKSVGVNYLLSIFCLVWAGDIAAYFGGRRFGRRSASW